MATSVDARSIDLAQLTIRDLSLLRNRIGQELKQRELRQRITETIRSYPRWCLIRTTRGVVGRVIDHDYYDGITVIIEVRGETTVAAIWDIQAVLLREDEPAVDLVAIETAVPTIGQHLAYVREGFAQPVDQAQLAQIRSMGAAAEAGRGARILSQMKGGR